MIRHVERSDLSDLGQVLSTIDLFPQEALPEMIHDYLENSESQDRWFTHVVDNKGVSLGYCAPEKFTDGTYNLYAVGVHASHQRKGIGTAMMQYIEKELRKSGHRILIVETSGSGAMAPVRAFYLNCGYQQEATIKDFWQQGEDKVIFSKRLQEQ